MRFHTGLVLLNPLGQPVTQTVVDTVVRFRDLDLPVIERYLRAEQPYDCAGSAKSEGLGISLIASMQCPDPTALVGLPLIALCDALLAAGFVLPAQANANANASA
jgi:septum formation protein